MKTPLALSASLLLWLTACSDPNADEARAKLAQKNVQPTEANLLAQTKSPKNEDTAKLLVLSGVDPNATQANGMTVLMSAVFNGQEDVARALIEKGARVDATAQGFNALSLAVERDNTGMIKLLMAAGADPRVRPPGGSSAIEKAQQQNKPDLVKLMEAGK